MKIAELKALLANGEFHHATYRCIGSLWEGLWIYKKYNGLRGFEPVGNFPKDSADLAEAESIVRHTGISVGSFGQG